MEMEMVFLGEEERKSKKTGKPYKVAVFQKEKKGSRNPDIFKFFVSDEGLKQELGVLQQFQPCRLTLELKAFNGNAQVDLIGVQ
jgi:hypothetical protein